MNLPVVWNWPEILWDFAAAEIAIISGIRRAFSAASAMPHHDISDLSGFLETLQQLVREPSVVGTEGSRAPRCSPRRRRLVGVGAMRSRGCRALGCLVAATVGQISDTTLKIPTTGYHTASETASHSSIRAARRLLDCDIR